MTIAGTCHCGAVGFEIDAEPQALVDCNCTTCRRLGALWGHIDQQAFRRTRAGTTIAYMHGDRMLAFHTCTQCGCTTHWENHHPENTHMAVNFRMCEPDDVARFNVRKFDGFDTWEFID
ncbi:MAG: GFA family protein [Pseudomonadota bacterium]